MKFFKSWSYDYNEKDKSITIYIQDINEGWLTLATISNCPRGNMTDEEFDNEYNDLMTDVIDELGYESIWCQNSYQDFENEEE